MGRLIPIGETSIKAHIELLIKTYDCLDELDGYLRSDKNYTEDSILDFDDLSDIIQKIERSIGNLTILEKKKERNNDD